MTSSSTNYSIDLIPDEILLEIFEYLPSDDLLSLTATCRKFNSLILNTQLSEKFQLQLNLANYNREWIGDRRYKEVFIDAVSARHYLYILAQNGSDVKNLCFNCHETDVVIVKQVLLMCPNVKKLWLYNFEIPEEFYPDELGDPRPCYELDYLYVQGSVEIMKMLQNCTTKKLDIHRLHVDDGGENTDEEELRFFLKSQKNLTDLKLSRFHHESNFLSNDTLDHVEFKLTTLKLKYFDNHSSVHFKNFMGNFKNSLTHLEVDKCHHDILNSFKDFKNLKNLKIFHFCGHIEPILTVENLALTHVDGNISEKFPNTKNLTVYYGVDQFHQISNLKQLKVLNIIDCEISELKIPPTVKILSLENVSSDIQKPFNFKESEIEELHIKKIKNCDWICDFLLNFAFRLKFLKIQKSILSQESQKAIFNSSKLIKCIQIINCDGIEEGDLDSSESEDDEDENQSENRENSDQEVQEDN